MCNTSQYLQYGSSIVSKECLANKSLLRTISLAGQKIHAPNPHAQCLLCCDGSLGPSVMSRGKIYKSFSMKNLICIVRLFLNNFSFYSSHSDIIFTLPLEINCKFKTFSKMAQITMGCIIS